MKHTSGKWKISGHSTFGAKNTLSEIYISEDDNHGICTVNGNNRREKETKANAKLIAESPNTIDRLIFNTKWLELLIESKQLSVGSQATAKEIVYWNNEQIKKATL